MAYISQRAKLAIIASETHNTNRAIIAETYGASFKSTRFDKASPLVSRDNSQPIITVRNIDTFSAGRDLLGPECDNHGHVACLNMASAESPGGRWLSGSFAQEEMVRF
jgi:uncharacterized protein (TIGR02452 family)